ncbi:MAG: ABC transporter permease [Planctomycetota bacterium]|nr:ABC transporter permease [Planctomycetota bacterium]
MANGNAQAKSSATFHGPILVLGLVLLLAVIVKLCGADPRQAFEALLRGSAGSSVAWGQTLASMAVLCFSGLAIAVSFRAGIFNIGAEGQFVAGAIAAAALGTRVLPEGVPAALGLPLLLLAGAAAGAGWSMLAGAMKRWRGVSEVISTLMLNLVALILLRYVVSYPFLLRDPATIEGKGAPLPDGAALAGWGGTGFHAGVFLTLPAVALLWLLVFRTRAGLSLRAAGLNPTAAHACGIPVERVRMLVFALSGALAGLGGAMAMMAAGRLTKQLYPDYGYMAIAVALAAGLHPLAVLPSALLFALLETGSKAMERSANVPSEVIFLIEGLVILALLSRGIRLPGTRVAASAAADAGGEA